MKIIFVKVSGETTFAVSFVHVFRPSMLARMGCAAFCGDPEGNPVWVPSSRSREGGGEPLSRWETEEHIQNPGDTGASSHVWGPGTLTRIHTSSKRLQRRVQIGPQMEGQVG